MNVIDQVNEVWGFHQNWNVESDVRTRCLAVVVDDRFVIDPKEDDELLRLAASFGENPFPMGARRGFISYTPFPFKYVTGLHCIGTKGSVVRLHDMWFAGPFDADGSEGNPRRGEEMARAWLSSLSDDDYAVMAAPKLARRMVTARALHSTFSVEDYANIAEVTRRIISISGRTTFLLESAIVKNVFEPWV